jgi:Transposase
MTAYLARYPGRQIAVALEQKRGALYPSGSKGDPKDADLLLDLLTQHRDRLRRLDPDTEETRKLQLLVEKRRKLGRTDAPGSLFRN